MPFSSCQVRLLQAGCLGEPPKPSPDAGLPRGAHDESGGSGAPSLQGEFPLGARGPPSTQEDFDTVSVGSLGSISTAPPSLESEELVDKLRGKSSSLPGGPSLPLAPWLHLTSRRPFFLQRTWGSTKLCWRGAWRTFGRTRSASPAFCRRGTPRRACCRRRRRPSRCSRCVMGHGAQTEDPPSGSPSV